MQQDMSELRTQISELVAKVDRLQDVGNVSRGHDQASRNTSEGSQDTSEGRAFAPSKSQNRGRISAQLQDIGPTRSAFAFDVANKPIQTMGIEHSRLDVNSAATVYDAQPDHYTYPEGTKRVVDPLLTISMGETYHAIEVYKESLDPVYPFVSLTELVDLVPQIYEHLQHAQGSLDHQKNSTRCCLVDNYDVQILKLVIAAALVFEGLGRSKLGQLLFDSAELTRSTRSDAAEVEVKRLKAHTLMVHITHFTPQRKVGKLS